MIGILRRALFLCLMGAYVNAADNFKELYDYETEVITAVASAWGDLTDYPQHIQEMLLNYFFVAVHVASADLAYNELKANVMQRAHKLSTYTDNERDNELKQMSYDCATLKALAPIKDRYTKIIHRIEHDLDNCQEISSVLEMLRDDVFGLMSDLLEQRMQEIDTLLIQAGDVMADETLACIARACHALVQEPMNEEESPSLAKLTTINALLNPLQTQLMGFAEVNNNLMQAVNFTLMIGRWYFIQAYNAFAAQYYATYGAPRFTYTDEETERWLPNAL